MGFKFVNQSRIRGIRSLNSKAGHLVFNNVNDFNITDVTITAPDDSPNTDGIKISSSSNVQISNSQIGTGDDCIAILSGTTNLNIHNIRCGPGHGISVGSLGKYKDEKNVVGLTVRDSIFTGTVNGIRIKTWEFAASEIIASNFLYENLQMNNVKYPIVIDQKYCPHKKRCSKKGDEHIQIENVTFNNIWGTSMQKEVVTLNCSQSVPCKNIRLRDVNLIYKGADGPGIRVCNNVHGKASGIC